MVEYSNLINTQLKIFMKKTFKKLIRKISPLENLYIKIKAWLQEKKARKSLEFYEKKIEGNYPKNKEEIEKALKERLLRRNIISSPKKKGELHIFTAYPSHNWEKIIPKALSPFGKVSVFDWLAEGFDSRNEKDWPGIRDEMNRALLKKFWEVHSRHPVDIFFGYVTGYSVSPETLKKIADEGVIVFNFSWDDKLQFPGPVIGGRYASAAALAGDVDLNLTNAPEAVVKYYGHGGLAMFWPEPALPEIHRPYDLPFEFDVSFVGGKYGWRPKFIQKLRKAGIDVECFGSGWENGPISGEEMIKLYSKSRINLGFSGIGYSKKLMCLKGRDFEVPMSGGLYLTQNNPELELVYNVGKEIVTYEDKKD